MTDETIKKDLCNARYGEVLRMCNDNKLSVSGLDKRMWGLLLMTFFQTGGIIALLLQS